jgi:O-succinylhomoserine sulfhydrylase
VASFLEGHPGVNWVKYPFLPSHPQYHLARKQMKAGGCVVAFEVAGGVAGGRRFFDRIKLLSLSANLGDSRSIVTHPASTTHSKLSPEERKHSGISDGMVRISVGLEHPEDVIADLQQALDE